MKEEPHPNDNLKPTGLPIPMASRRLCARSLRLILVLFISPIFLVLGCGSGSHQLDPRINAFLYAANIGSNSISGYGVMSESGQLLPLAQFPLPTGPDSLPQVVFATPAGNFLYVSTSDGYRGYHVDRGTGTLTELSASPFPIFGTPVIDPAGLFLVTLVSNAIRVSTIDGATGTLTPVGIPLFFPEERQGPRGLAISEDSKFVYVSRLQDILIFRLDTATGTLSESSASPFRPPQTPGSIAVVGEFLMLAAPFHNAVGVYSISPDTGGLTPVSESPFPIGRSPVGQMFLHPNGTLLFVFDLPACCLPSPELGISALVVDRTTGSVSGSSSAIPFDFQPCGFSVAPRGAIHPSGNFLYAGDACTSISGYRIDDVSGALQPLSGSPFPAVPEGSSQPVSVALVLRQR